MAVLNLRSSVHHDNNYNIESKFQCTTITYINVHAHIYTNNYTYIAGITCIHSLTCMVILTSRKNQYAFAKEI